MTTKDTTIEELLAMYRETVSPSEIRLRSILSQIPEQQQPKERRAIRSPYRWLVVSQVMSLAMLFMFVYPAYTTSSQEDPDYYFYAIDSQIQSFEAGINQEDYTQTLN